MVKQQVKTEIPLDLDQAFVYRIPYLVFGITIDYFNGDADKVFIQESEDPNQTLTRNALRQNKFKTWSSATQVYIVNTLAQAGKKLKISLVGQGEAIESGLHAGQIQNSDAVLIDPATEEKQDDLISLVGEVQETPTAYTLLARLKALRTNLGDLITGQKTGIGSGDDVCLVAASTPVPDGFAVVVRTFTDGAGIVYIGAEGVTSATGFPLWPGDAIALLVDDIALLWAIASVADQKVAYAVEKESA